MHTSVFTTGMIAKICKVAPQTVTKWFDSGRLMGYRLPGSQDRRVLKDHLAKFLRDHGMDHALCSLEQTPILVLSNQPSVFGPVMDLFSHVEYKAMRIGDTYAAGTHLASCKPLVVLVDESFPDCPSLWKTLSEGMRGWRPHVILLSESGALPYQALRPSEVFRKPFDNSLLLARMHSILHARN